MKQNVGSMDRILRVVIGLVLLALAYMGNFGAYAWAGYVGGAVALLTAAAGSCGLYSLLGMSTCAVKTKS